MSTPDPIEVQLARIEVKLDAALTGHVDHETRIRELESLNLKSYAPRLDTHGSRLDALERWRYALPATLLVGVGSIATTVLMR